MNDKRVVCDCGERRRVEEGGPKTVAVGAASVTVVSEDEIVYPSPAEILDPMRPFRERVAELEAEVAAREARCAALVKGLQMVALYVAHEPCDPFEAPAAELRAYARSLGLAERGRKGGWTSPRVLLRRIAQALLACPDLAAARLLAEARLGRATYTLKHQNVIDTPAAEIPAADEEFAAAGEALEVAYREAVAAEEKADE